MREREREREDLLLLREDWGERENLELENLERITSEREKNKWPFAPQELQVTEFQTDRQTEFQTEIEKARNLEAVVGVVVDIEVVVGVTDPEFPSNHFLSFSVFILCKFRWTWHRERERALFFTLFYNNNNNNNI